MTDQSFSQTGGSENEALPVEPEEVSMGGEPVPASPAPDADEAAPVEEAAAPVFEELVEEENPPGTLPPPPGPPRGEAARPAYVTRGQAVWIALLTSLLTLCLASALSLAFLWTINGGIRYAHPAQLTSLEARLEGLSLHAGALQTDLDELDTRLQALEGLDGRVAEVEAEMEQARLAVDEAAAELAGFQSKIDDLSLQVDALLTRVGRFQGFLDGLEGLLQTLAEPQP